MSVIRLSSANRDSLCALAAKVLAAWRAYSDPAVMIYSETEGIAHDRARNALMEKRSVKQQYPVPSLRLHLAAINVHNVGNELEGVEGYAYRERDGGNG